MNPLAHQPAVPGGTQDGTTQAQRGLAALDTPFQVDALGMDQLLALTRRLAAKLRYVDANGRSSGTWEELFEHDGTLVLADMASFSRRAWDRRFELLCAGPDPIPAAQQLLDMVEQLDRWLRALDNQAEATSGGLADSPALGALHDGLRQAIKGQLAGQLTWVLATFGSRPREGLALLQRAQGLSADWTDSPPWTPAGDNKRRQLQGVGRSLSTALGRLQGMARERLPQTLGGGRHDPAVGLLLSFLQLYGLVQAETNRLGERHIDFYHREVLGFAPRAAVPDRVHVLLQADALRVQPVVVPAGTLFPAGKGPDGQPLTFASDAAATAGQARVAALSTLRLERDDDVQPEADLGYVSAVRANSLGLPPPDAEPVPTLGGGRGSHDAALGLAVASPLLLLKEGRRRIDLEVQLDWPGPKTKALRRLASCTKDGDVFRNALGQLYARWLLGDTAMLGAEHRDRLRRQAQGFELHSRSVRHMLDEPTPGQAPQQMEFFRVVTDLFELSLTHAEGWLVARNVQLEKLPVGQSGFRLVVWLKEEDPSIGGCNPAVHGQAWPTRLPVLKLQASPRARIHPLSIFEHASVARVLLSVKVDGVRDLVVHNQLGLLDASKVFAPFGPLPNLSSALVVGSPEAAAKNLDSLSLTFDWSGLPASGLQAHYAAYGREQAEGPFTVALSLLRDGVWRPCGGASSRQSLFAQADAEGREPALQQVLVDPLSVRENARASSQPLEPIAAVRDGLLRLQLNHPPGAFGHSAYAGLLSQAVTTRTRRRGATAMPEAPYTPELQSLRLHYVASSTLDPMAKAAALQRRGEMADDVERLLHVHPFGVAALCRSPEGQAPGVLPPLGADGSLFIGLSLPPEAEGLSGVLTLLFQMLPKGAASLAAGADRAPVSWAYLANDQWQVLDSRDVLSDTTYGLLTTGVVSLDLPRGARADNALLGRGLYWLRVSGNRELQATADLISVHAHAATLSRVLDAVALPSEPLAAGRISQTASPVPGLAAVLQPAAGTGLVQTESAAQLRLRVAERLRHKNRASLAWDYERLVLALAPDVHKVKCFMAPAAGLNAGEVLVAVLPATRRNTPDMGTQAQHLDVLALQRIHELLRERASPMVRLRVRNVSFERVQVRCRVLMERHAQSGALQRDINRALVQYLSPWHDAGFGPRLDWQLRCEDLQAEVRRVPGVAGVVGVSLLHVVLDDNGLHHFADTAAPGHAADVLRARHPWSVVLPVDDHLIELVEHTHDTKPRASGLTHLEVAETWVVSQGKAGLEGTRGLGMRAST
jgi:hypothetical protein